MARTKRKLTGAQIHDANQVAADISGYNSGNIIWGKRMFEVVTMLESALDLKDITTLREIVNGLKLREAKAALYNKMTH